MANKNNIKKLEELKEKVLILEKKITKQKYENFKYKSIRNIKIFGNTCNLIAPIILTIGLTIGTYKLLGAGLPFTTDKIKKFKHYNLDYQTNGNISIEETYEKDNLENVFQTQNKLIIYTPWEYKNNQYTRFKKEFNVENIDNLDILNTILEKDYEKIPQIIKDYKEEIQISYNIDNNQYNSYIIDAKLSLIDKNDTLYYNETEFKNITITFLELITIFCTSGLITYLRNFNYTEKIKQNLKEYHLKIKDIKPLQEELQNTNDKIMILSRKIGHTK